jgi:hypothetical protein
MPDGAVLTGTVHTLKNQKQRIAVGRVEKALQRTQRLNVFFQELSIRLLGFAKRLYNRRPLSEFHLFFRPHTEIF